MKKNLVASGDTSFISSSRVINCPPLVDMEIFLFSLIKVANWMKITSSLSGSSPSADIADLTLGR